MTRTSSFGSASGTIHVNTDLEFILRALYRWAYENGFTLDSSWPSKPTDNAFVDSFNGRLRDEWLNPYGFLSLADAVAKIAAE